MASNVTPEQQSAQVDEQSVAQESACSVVTGPSSLVAQQQSATAVTVTADAIGTALPSAANIAIIAAKTFIELERCTRQMVCLGPFNPIRPASCRHTPVVAIKDDEPQRQSQNAAVNIFRLLH